MYISDTIRMFYGSYGGVLRVWIPYPGRFLRKSSFPDNFFSQFRISKTTLIPYPGFSRFLQTKKYFFENALVKYYVYQIDPGIVWILSYMTLFRYFS